MRRIYKGSSVVYVWLGDEADDSSTAMDILSTLAAPKPTPGEKAIHYPSFTEEDVARHWKALKALLKRPWWERVWIGQEIALNYYITISCGSKTFDMSLIGPALHMLDYVKSLGYESFDASRDEAEGMATVPWDTHARKLLALQERTHSGTRWVKLSDLLFHARGCKATDSRDLVFSILGLADPEVYPIVPSYRDNLRDILIMAAGSAIQQESGLDILSSCQNPEKKYGLPSWVPNVVDEWKTTPFHDRRTKHGIRSKTYLHETKEDVPDLKIDGETLLLKGGFYDSIRMICDDTVKRGTGVEELEAIFAAWEKFVRGAAELRLIKANEGYEYDAQAQMERKNMWLMFLSVSQKDTEGFYSQKRGINRGQTTFEDPGLSSYRYSKLNLNYRLGRGYLLPTTYTAEHLHHNRDVHNALLTNCVGRRLGVTKQGYVALLPAEVESDDVVAVFKGASIPYILRKAERDDDYVLVGEAFIASFASGRSETVVVDKQYLKDWIRVC
jgi:hypothetical protein